MTRISIITALLLTAACTQEAPPAEPLPEPAPAAAAAVEPAPAVPAPEPELTPEELPIEQDFEEEVAAQITPQNFRGELAKLEAEIAADTAE